MHLTPAQLEAFDRDGFLRFENLFDHDEIETLRAELMRVSKADDPSIIRERNGALRTVYRTHELDGPTQSHAFRALACSPRFLAPARQVLRDDELYIFHSKCNIKTAIDGTVWLWHQDYGYWQHDGVPTPNMATFLVMLDEATELSGCLYFLPGSHKREVFPAIRDTTPVAITGGPGTAVLFHCKMVHASGHNLAANDRWHVYMAYNPVANHPDPIPAEPRPDYVVSTNYTPLELMPDDAIRKSPVTA
jgi:ectoine hydroxylase